MKERSVLESSSSKRQEQDSGIAFGRITAVNPANRTCSVNTFMAKGNRNDNSIPICQWINLDNNPSGGSSAVIPSINSYGLVFWADGEPFIFGMFAPLDDAGSALTGSDDDNNEDEDGLNEGDRIFSTAGGNKIILRASGIIQIQCSAITQTIFFPDQELINTICRNYEFAADGGTISWENFDTNNDTFYSAEYRDNISRANVIIVERGSVDGDIISSYSIGPGTDDGIDAPVYSNIIHNTGEVELAIGASAAGLGLNIKPDGTTNLVIAGKTTVGVQADGSVSVSVAGSSFTLNIDASGNVTLTAAGTLDITASGKATITADMIDIDGGGELQQVLTTPNAVSQFTGLPLQVGSETVKASI